MKKLLFVLLVVALAAFLLVGCIPVTPPVEGEGEGEVEICPTLTVSGEVTITGAKYLKKGTQTITVTFAEATQPVAVYVGAKLDGDTATKGNPVGVPETAQQVVMSADATKKVYTGKFYFEGDKDCDTAYIYVVTCATCAPCPYAYTVDNAGPCSKVKIYEDPTTGCSCGGVNIRFKTPAPAGCDTYCCGDYCSGLDTYKFDLYKADPFGLCCDVPCLSPVATCGGTGCAIDCTISCFDITAYTLAANKDFYLVTTLTDKVGNKTKYYAILNIDTKDILKVTGYIADKEGGLCTSWTKKAVMDTADTIGACANNTTGVCALVLAQ
jgi:hypothetical protein